MKKKPNVVLVITDDQGYGDMACHGNPWISTPSIDSFYSDSIRLTDFHAGPTCAPTRASLLTGRYANSTGVWHTIGGRSLLRREEVTLATALQNDGYRTGLFGKWHLGDNAPYRPQDRGFDRVVTHGGGGVGQAPDWWGNDYWDDTYISDGDPVKYSGYCTDVWFDRAEEFIRDSADTPFFCYLAPNAPHEPYNIMEEWRELYRDRLDAPQSTADRRARFYGMISHLDGRFGKLRNLLSELSIEDNTILIFMTDNGTSCGAEFDEDGRLMNGWNAGLRGIKCSEYDGGHRVPVFISWPEGLPEVGRDVERVTSTVDMMPTVLDLCGVDHQMSFHGRSLRPLLKGIAGDWPARYLVTDSQRVPDPIKWRQSAVMSDRWRLVNGRELYDILEDREQGTDLAAEQPGLVGEMRDAYEEWWNLVQPDFPDEIPIEIGPEHGSVRLSSHDWRGSGDDIAWNQGHIRQGMMLNGYWEIEVTSAGRYDFRLYRWPEEGCGAGLCDSLTDEDDDWNPDVVEKLFFSWYSGGVGLPIVSADLRVTFGDGTSIGGESRDVDGEAPFVSLPLDLPEGRARLQTFFRLDDAGNTGAPTSLGAYYVGIRPVDRG